MLFLMIATVYLFCLGVVVVRWHKEGIAFMLALPVLLFIFFGPR